MIAHSHRFHGRNSIQRLYKNGASVRSGSLSLRFAANPKRSRYRAAVVVSRKVSKSAVVRNRIRRRLYENIRALSTDFTAAYDLVFMVYDEKIAEMAPAAVTHEMVSLLRKARLLSMKSPTHGIVEPEKKQ